MGEPARGPLSDSKSYGRGFWVALLIGWSIILGAIWGLVDQRKGLSGALRVGGWLLGGVVIHDFVIAPAVVAIGLLFAHHVEARWRPPLQVGLAVTMIVLFVSIPLLGGFGRKAHNRSVLPLDYPTAVATVVAAVWGLVLVWLVVRVARGRTTHPGPRGERDPLPGAR
jgi:hypothetical protein